MTKYNVHFKSPLVGLVDMYYNRSIETKVSVHNKMQYDVNTRRIQCQHL